MKSLGKIPVRLLAVVLVIIIIIAALVLTGVIKGFGAKGAYDNAVLKDRPVGYRPIAPGVGKDFSGNGIDGKFMNSPSGAALPNGDPAVVFNGVDQYFEVEDNDYLEITRTGKLTVEAWMRPDVLEFPKWEDNGYIHWMGKGTAGQYEYLARMYNLKNGENRPNRISGYIFNLTGGLGTGSYFQDPVAPGYWIHFAMVVNTVDTGVFSRTTFPTGYTKVYKNGELCDMDALKDYDIVPGDGTAPFRVGTTDFESFFKGAVGKVAIYDYELTAEQLAVHYKAMGSPPSNPQESP